MPPVSMMNNRCDIERDGASAGSWGEKSPSYSNNTLAQQCRYYVSTIQYSDSNYTRHIVEQQKVLFPLTADVTLADRLDNIRDRAGTEIASGPIQITAIIRRRNHFEARCRRVIGG